MDRFLALVVRGRAHAALIAAGFLVLPWTSFVAAAIAALVTLRFGLAQGAIVLAMTLGVGGLATLALYGDVYGVLTFGAVLGAPVVLLAAWLRFSGSQGAVVVAAGVLGAVAISAVHLATGDPTDWWRGLLERQLLGRLPDTGQALDPEALARLREVIDFVAPLMSVTLVWFVVVLLLVLYLARWAQARLDNPGGFGREFRELRLDRRVSYVAVGVAALAWLAPQWAGGLAGLLLLLVVVLHTVQGVAIAHWFAASRKSGASWLTAMYLALVFVPLVVVPIAVTGFSDTWMDWRGRSGRTGPGDS